MRFTSLLSLKAILHTLFGNLMKDEKDELNFRSEADEVRVMILLNLHTLFGYLIRTRRMNLTLEENQIR